MGMGNLSYLGDARRWNGSTASNVVAVLQADQGGVGSMAEVAMRARVSWV